MTPQPNVGDLHAPTVPSPERERAARYAQLQDALNQPIPTQKNDDGSVSLGKGALEVASALKDAADEAAPKSIVDRPDSASHFYCADSGRALGTEGATHHLVAGACWYCKRRDVDIRQEAGL